MPSSTTPAVLPTDTAMLLWAFGNRKHLRGLLTSGFDWDTSTPDTIRAAIAVAMAQPGQPNEADRGDIEAFVLGMRHTYVPAPDAHLERLAPPPQPSSDGRARKPFTPQKFANTTMNTFDVNIAGAAYAQQLGAAKRAVLAWVELAATGKRACLALVGSPGNGKSTLLWGAVDALFHRNVKVFGRPWYRLADELRYGGKSPWNEYGTALEAQQLRALLHSTRVVALDEICPTAGTTFDESELGKLVKNAYDHDQALIVATNVHPLANLMGDAAADRFTIVQLTAPSRRKE